MSSPLCHTLCCDEFGLFGETLSEKNIKLVSDDILQMNERTIPNRMKNKKKHNSHQCKKHSHSLNRDLHPTESTPPWNDHLLVKIGMFRSECLQ